MSNLILDEDFNYDQKPSEFDAETVTKINLIKINADENIKFIKGGRTALLVLVGFTLLGTLIGMGSLSYGVSATEVIIEGVFLIAIYLTCAFFVSKNPQVSLIVALSIYILMILLSGLIDFSLIFKGILMKVAIIYYVSRAIKGALGLKKDLKNLFNLGIPRAEIEKLKKLEDIPRTPYPKEDLA